MFLRIYGRTLKQKTSFCPQDNTRFWTNPTGRIFTGGKCLAFSQSLSTLALKIWQTVAQHAPFLLSEAGRTYPRWTSPEGLSQIYNSIQSQIRKLASCSRHILRSHRTTSWRSCDFKPPPAIWRHRQHDLAGGFDVTGMRYDLCSATACSTSVTVSSSSDSSKFRNDSSTTSSLSCRKQTHHAKGRCCFHNSVLQFQLDVDIRSSLLSVFPFCVGVCFLAN